jgi:type I restriction enzyme S subunit
MESKWSTVRLGDMCEKIGSGATPRGGSEVYQANGIALIRSQNIYNDGFKWDGLAFVGEKHAQELENVTVQTGDILLNITGDSVARACQVPDNVLPARVNQHVAIIRPLQDSLDARYLRYYLVSPAMQQYMLALAAAGATRNALTKGMIEAFRIPAPLLSEQKAIAHILGTLDDKIELNRRMNETLEAMARAIFKSWFIDFDPVRAKMEGCQPSGMDAETAALFPDSFEDSPLGKIPKGWKVGTLCDLADNPRRSAQPKEIEPPTPYIGLEHMPRRCIALSEWGHAQELESNKFFFKKGEILFGKLRPYFYKVGVAPVDGVCSTDILVIAPKDPHWFGLALGHISSAEFINHTDASSTGTKMPRTNWQDMVRYEIVIPPKPIAEFYNNLSSSIVGKIIRNINEYRMLAVIRDALLPQLLSGEIKTTNISGDDK